jgi:hypothetical protein
VLEAGTSSTLFPCENCISFWKEYFIQVRILRWRKAHYVSDRPIQQHWRNMYLWNKTVCVRRRSIRTWFPLENWLSFGSYTSCKS